MKYCPECRQRFLWEVDQWPKECFECGETQYRNPTSVSVLMIPVWHQSCIGLLLVERGKQNDPGFGQLAFPGGYQEMETSATAADRETQQEADLYLQKEKFVRFGDILIEDKNLELQFWLAELIQLPFRHIEDFKPREEVKSLQIAMDRGTTLAFPAHQEMMNRFFSLGYEKARTTVVYGS